VFAQEDKGGLDATQPRLHSIVVVGHYRSPNVNQKMPPILRAMAANFSCVA
jgi:hypothetical protein